jgi:hypothetical protein
MKKQSKMARSAPKTVDTLLASTSLTQKERTQLEDAASSLQQVQRRSTAHVFERGEHLERATAILADELWERWVQMRCGFSARKARLDRAVFRNLTSYKDVLVELAVGSTVLGKLSSADPHQIEAAIAFAQEHGRLKVTDVTAILKGEDGSDNAGTKIDPHDVGGIDGLKALIALKVRDGLKSFIGHCEEIRADVLMALAEKRIVKKALADQTVLTARLARKELESLVEFVTPNPNYPNVIWPTHLPNQTRWKLAADVLYRMGNLESWPDAKVLRGWLEGEVVPALVWATSKSKSPEWLLADPKEKSAPAPVVLASDDDTISVPEMPVDEADIKVLPALEIADDDWDDVDDDELAAEIQAAEAEELAKAERLAAAVERLRPAMESLGGTVTIASPKASTSKRKQVATPSLADDYVEQSVNPDRKRALAEADLPSLEEATGESGPGMR